MSDWRSVDPTGGHGSRAPSVRAVVLRIQRTLGIACLAEGALLFLAGGALSLALAARAGAGLAQPGNWFLAGLCGLLAALCWVREHYQGASAIARSLDQRMRHQGSLVTAYELEARSSSSAMGQLLVRRVLERLRLREALRAMFPSLVIPIAAPLLSLGLLGLSLETRREEAQVRVELGDLTQGLVATLGGLEEAIVEAGQEGQIKNETIRELLALGDRAKSLQRRSDLLAEEPAKALEELASLSQDMADMAARVQGQPALSEPLEQAANWMDAARMELRASLEQAAQNLTPKQGPGGSQTVTSAGEKGMMSGPGSQGSSPGQNAAKQPAPSAPTPAAVPIHQPSSGALAGDYWPPEYDGVVSGWIELQRRTQASNNR